MTLTKKILESRKVHQADGLFILEAGLIKRNKHGQLQPSIEQISYQIDREYGALL